MKALDYRVAQAILEVNQAILMNRPAEHAFGVLMVEFDRLHKSQNEFPSAVILLLGVAAAAGFVAGLMVGLMYAIHP